MLPGKARLSAPRQNARSNHALRVLHRDAALATLEEDDGGDDHDHDEPHDGQREGRVSAAHQSAHVAMPKVWWVFSIQRRARQSRYSGPSQMSFRISMPAGSPSATARSII